MLSGPTAGRFQCSPADADDPAWSPVDHLLDDPAAVERLVRAAGSGRFASDDRALVLAQIAREAIAVLVAAGVHAWATERRVPDLSAANVLLRDGPTGVVVGLRRPRSTVPPAHPEAGTAPDVEVLEEPKLFACFLDRVLGDPAPLGAAPPGPADRVAAVAAVVATVRRVVRVGDRHLWGTAALTLSSTLTRLGHTLGERADDDRRRILAARPDLARTIELVTVADPDDPAGAPVTFAIRRTCCLLLKLPAGHQCGTCSLRDRDACVARMTAWALAGRAEARAQPAPTPRV
ncbi:MAG TPA: hypothetical protein VIL36_19955 [Acidimicrobiales bacterium]